MNYAMRMLANRHTRRLFGATAGTAVLFTVAAAAAAVWGRPHAAVLVVGAGACLGLSLLGGLYLYFRNQKQILEQAVAQVQAYLAGNTDARLPCEEEGELYGEVFSPSRSILHPQLAVNGWEAVVSLLTPTTRRCPHLGCALKWNPREHTWDCPCHGSRFTKDGKLIDNPATGDLKN